MRFAVGIFLLPLLALWASPPVPYYGKVSIDGINHQGSAQFQFSLKDANGTTHWQNGMDANESILVSVVDGRYSVMLGGQGMNPLPPELFIQHDELYLSVRFDTDGGLQSLGPDQLIAAAPRALVAEVSKVAEVAKVAEKLLGDITSDMLSPEVLSKLDVNQSAISIGPITLSMLSPEVTAKLESNASDRNIGPITLDMLPAEVLADRNKAVTITREMLPVDVLADLNKSVTITRDMLSADVLADLKKSTSAITSITRDMLPLDVLADLNKSVTITRDMLSAEILADLKKSTSAITSITRDMLPADVLADLNKSFPEVGPITLSMLDAEVTAKLDQDSTLEDGSVTPSKIATNSITTNQLSEQILKYLKPEITTQPQTQTVYVNTNASFFVSAEGKYITYQWKKDGINLIAETNATLTLTDANATLHDGNYSVVVSNDFGSVESGLTEVLVNDGILNGLVGWWKFDETNGTVAYDSSGNGNDGYLTNGPTWTEGKIGGSLSFDGVDDRVALPNSALNGLTNLTLNLWTKLNSGSQDHFFISGAFSSQHNHFLFGLTNTNEIHIWDGNSKKNGHSYPPSNWDGKWINITLIRKIDGSGSQIFIDSVNVNSKAYNASALSIADKGLWVGADQDRVNGGWESTQFLDGLIDEVRIYDRALSADEVQALYNMGQYSSL